MKIAIVGAGLCGLAACWHLLDEGEVTLFDPEGVGGGASGVACGLLHPYVGEKARLSENADEAMAEARALLEVSEKALGKEVADRSGIRRIIPDLKIAEQIHLRTQYFEDIEWTKEQEFLIHSGITVYSALYMEGLWTACEKRGAMLIRKKVETLEELGKYDRIIVANGSGAVRFFPEILKEFSLIKGQVLCCKVRGEDLERSVIGKGYIAKTEKPGIVHVGTTYERNFSREGVDEEVAKQEIHNKMRSLYPQAIHWQILGYKAGVRLSRKGHYLPLLQKIDDRVTLLTGMGSRGLLYHAYYAKKVVKDAILQ